MLVLRSLPRQKVLGDQGLPALLDGREELHAGLGVHFQAQHRLVVLLLVPRQLLGVGLLLRLLLHTQLRELAHVVREILVRFLPLLDGGVHFLKRHEVCFHGRQQTSAHVICVRACHAARRHAPRPARRRALPQLRLCAARKAHCFSGKRRVLGERIQHGAVVKLHQQNQLLHRPLKQAKPRLLGLERMVLFVRAPVALFAFLPVLAAALAIAAALFAEPAKRGACTETRSDAVAAALLPTPKKQAFPV
mmetsp:Transcript_80961/g.158198  ORF Transcript_80961/g.158198 Transcript_80961/m.158198 type:complete len:249 (-) Transcript_80961:149-895(-)